MKKISLIIVSISLFLSACTNPNIIDSKEVKSDGYKLNLKSYFEIDSAIWYSEKDSITSSKSCDLKDLMNIKQINYTAPFECPTVGVIDETVFLVDELENGKSELSIYDYKNDVDYKSYSICYGKQISNLFEKDGYLLYTVSNSNVHRLMKYNKESKTSVMLNETTSDISPLYYNCGSYIGIVPNFEKYIENGQAVPKESIKFCDFETGNLIENTISIDYLKEVPIIANDIENDYLITHNYSTKQLVFYDVTTGEIVSQCLLSIWDNQWNVNLKIFGNYLLLCDSNGLKVYDFEKDKYYLIYYHDYTEYGVGGYDKIAEIINDYVVFTDTKSLLIYNLKTEDSSIIANKENIKSYSTDNTSSFIYAENINQTNNSDFYPITKFILK